LKRSVSFVEGSVFFAGSAALRKSLSVALQNSTGSGCGTGVAAGVSAAEVEIWTSTAAAGQEKICVLGEGNAALEAQTAASSSFSNL